MDCKFVVGQPVVCIKDDAWRNIWGWCTSGPDPKKGEICIITEILPSDYGIFLKIKGYRHNYDHIRFRALQEKPKKSSIEVLKKLITPVVKPIKEDA